MATRNTVNDQLKIGPAGLALIKEKEGWSSKAYRDPVGVWTIGWGTTGADARPGRVITKAQGEEFLRRDLEEAENDVKRLVKVPLNQYEFDALVSFVYNLGATKFAQSTLLKLLNRGNRQAAAGQFAMYNHARDRNTGEMIVLNGLTKRRAQEAALFLRDPEEESEADEVSWNMEDQAEIDADTHESGIQPDRPTRVAGALGQVIKNSDTFKALVATFTGIVAAVSQLLEPLKENPVAMSGTIVAIFGISAILYIKTRDTSQGR